MRLTFQILLLVGLLAVTGCAGKKNGPPGAAPKAGKAAPDTKPIIKPSDALIGQVVSFNVVGRFAVLNFPVNRMPAIDQMLFVYRDGLKVGEIKITGPQKDDNIVGDLTTGDAKAGDEVRDR